MIAIEDGQVKDSLVWTWKSEHNFIVLSLVCDWRWDWVFWKMGVKKIVSTSVLEDADEVEEA